VTGWVAGPRLRPGYSPVVFSSRQPSTARYLGRIVVVVLVLLVGVWFGGHPSWLPSPLRSAFTDDSNGDFVQNVLNQLSSEYYRPLNRSALANDGLTAAVASLNDPYSHYYGPGEYRSFLNTSNPHLSGVGIDVLPVAKGLQVEDVFPNSPAARAGLSRGDVIVEVGKVSLANRSADFSSNLIKGAAGTKVTLTVIRSGRSRVVTITRQNLVIPVASGSVVTYHGTKIGDVTLTSFTDGSGAELRTQVNKVLAGGARALILDLRENGGGLLDEAVNVASIFIPDGTIVTTRGRSQPTQVYTAQGGAVSTSIPMVVLVDRGTASAAEIVTAALQDHHRALVVGTHTYGKGVFQEIQPLSNGGALDITVGEYFTPNGRNLGGGGVREGAGIKPNVYAFMNPRSKTDTALNVAERTVAAEVH
jgi:carboxyl-terminal processing protease